MDHNPLALILGSNSLNTLLVWFHQLRMHLMRFQFSISHIPGKDLATADTIPRAPTSSSSHSYDLLLYVCLATQHLPIAELHMKQIAQLISNSIAWMGGLLDFMVQPNHVQCLDQVPAYIDSKLSVYCLCCHCACMSLWAVCVLMCVCNCFYSCMFLFSCAPKHNVASYKH